MVESYLKTPSADPIRRVPVSFDSPAGGTDCALTVFGTERPVQGAEELMLYYALVFLVLGLVASLLGAYGVAAIASRRDVGKKHV